MSSAELWSFGLICAPSRETVAAEVARVCHGRLGLTVWRPNEGPHAIYAAFSGEQPVWPSPDDWGREERLQELFAGAFELELEERVWWLEGDTPEDVWELMCDYLADSGVAVELFAKVPERANLVARIPGRGEGPRLLLLSHTDTVLADAAEWQLDPWSGELRDGEIWGRGALDMKGQVAANAVAIASLAREGFEPRGDLIFAATADEEVGEAFGPPWLFRETPAAAVDVGGGVHPLGGELVEPLLGMTVSPTIISASQKRNVIPALCELICDTRLLPSETQAEAETLLREVLGPGDHDFEWIEGQGGTRSPLGTPLWSAIESFVSAEEPEAKVAPVCLAGFTDSHWLREAFGTVAYGFFPLRTMDPELAARLVHSADERIAGEDLGLGGRFLRHLAQAIGG